MDFHILGARKGSLGAALKDVIRSAGDNAITWGITNDEDNKISDFDPSACNVICTIGINEPYDLAVNSTADLEWTMEHNLMVPLRYFQQWLTTPIRETPVTGSNPRGRFVFISSNSAHIARSGSLSYCASKAALSMAVRVAARDISAHRGGRGVWDRRYVWCYEPCWIEGTPMSQEVLDRLDGNLAHRIPGGKGVSRHRLAQLIHDNMRQEMVLHGACIRVDLGDQ
jgi:NAD(P)-dependent dehydrogenase (short-subunit alcohol dehydrogenase family)